MQNVFERFTYYIHLAATICQRIGAFNSDIYAKCVIGIAIDPYASTEEKARLLDDYTSKVWFPFLVTPDQHCEQYGAHAFNATLCLTGTAMLLL